MPSLGFEMLSDGNPPTVLQERWQGGNCLWLIKMSVLVLVKTYLGLISWSVCVVLPGCISQGNFLYKVLMSR